MGKTYSSEGCADAMCADAEQLEPPSLGYGSEPYEVVVWLREIDADTDNACWIICARDDFGAIPFVPR